MTILPKADYPGELRIHRDAEQLASGAAELFVRVAADSIKARRRFRVALSGGSTPRRVNELLATPAFSSRLDWNHIDLFLGDERYVPADDRDSNYRMVAETLLRHVSAPAANVHRVPTEINPPEAAAAAYEQDIRRCFGEPASVPHFDLIYLGLGTNGHTASLFPNSPGLKEKSKLVLADFVAELKSWRISMTAPLLNHGRTVAFLIEGRQKAQVLRDVLLGPRDPQRLPAQLIAPEGNLLWLVDEAAAALLSNAGREQRSA
jgi:6-phosphogluconolactonase